MTSFIVQKAIDVSAGSLLGNRLRHKAISLRRHGGIYEGRLQSLWTHLITPSRNFVEVRCPSLFRSTSLGKRCTSYNAPPTSRKRTSDRLPQTSGG